MNAFLLSVSRVGDSAAFVNPPAALSDGSTAGSELQSSSTLSAAVRLVGPDVTCWADTELIVVVAGDASLVECGAHEVGATATTPAEIARRWRSQGLASLDQLTGAFALAIWDEREMRLLLQVDPFGIRSLFFRITPERIMACTEVTPLLESGPAAVFDESALPDILSMRFLSGSRSVWRGVVQVTAGRRCEISSAGDVRESPSPRFSYNRPVDPSLDLETATQLIRSALKANLERLRDSGVPEVTVLLSGGVDSSVIAGMAVGIFSKCTAVTFEIDGFPNPELGRAKEVAKRLGMPMQVVTVNDDDVARLYPWIIARLQEPPLHYNNAVLVRMLEETRGIAPVILAGEFAATLGVSNMAGVRLQVARKKRFEALPSPVRRALSGLLRATRQPRLRRLANTIDRSVEQFIQSSRLIPVTHAASLAIPGYVQAAKPSEDLVARNFERGVSLEDASLLWTFRVLEQPILRRNTRFADALGLRYHYPMQDVAALDVATRLPPELKCTMDSELGKPILRELCAQLVGRDVSEWPKMGFATPELAWMQGPLAAQLAASLSDDAPVARYVDVRALRALPPEANQQTLWTVMTLDEVLRQGEAILRQ